MSKILRIFIFISIGFFSNSILQGQATPKVSVQGTLKDANGSAVDDGNYSVEFRLYSVESGGTAGWMEIASVDVVGGIYSHLLGSVVPLEATIFASTLYLGIKVGAFELVPRSELTYAPYTFSANTAQNVACSGAVGDVKYSILNPTQFAAANGDCWVPMDGGNMTGSTLAGILGTTTVPNAGGLFLRSQEFASSGNYDPERSTGSTIAQVQGEAFASHAHSGSTSTVGNHNHTGTTDGGGFGGTEIVSGGSGAVVANEGGNHNHNFTTNGAGSHNHNVTINPAGGNETRPDNMNLWIYIRIN